MSDTNLEKLTTKDKRDLAIEAGIQAIPYVGGSLATLYFGVKQEKRFKRLETFYKEVSQEIGLIKENIVDINSHDKDALVAIVEKMNEKVELEHTAQKRQYFKNYLKNTLLHPVGNNFDERQFFLETLGDMSLLEAEMLGLLSHQHEPTQIGSIQKPQVDQYAIVGAINRLKSFGFIISRQGSFSIGDSDDNTLKEIIQISDFGKKFVNFCL